MISSPSSSSSTRVVLNPQYVFLQTQSEPFSFERNRRKQWRHMALLPLPLQRHPQVASRVATVLVRATVLVSLMLSMAILTTDTTNIQVGINFLVEVKFLDVYSYRYMLGTTVIGAAYMLLQIANTIYRIYKSNQSDDGDGGLLFDFFGDKMVSYLLATGMAASFGSTGDLKATFEGSGSNVDKFFDKGYAAAGLLLFSFICTALLSIISSFSLPKNT